MGRNLAPFVLVMGVLATSAQATPSTLAGGESQRIEIRVPTGEFRLLLVEQRGIDLLLECRQGAITNAPSGRLGFEAALLDRDAVCTLSPKMAQSVRGGYRAEVLDPAAAPLGMDTAAWRLYAGLLLLDDQVQGSRQAAIAGFQSLLQLQGLEPRLRLHLEVSTGNLLRRIRESRPAIDHYERARQLAAEGEARNWLPTIGNALGQAQLELRDFDAAAATFRRARTLAAEQGNAYEDAAALNNLCLVAQHRGQTRKASRCYQRAIAGYRAAGEVEQIATPLMNWASAAQALGDPGTALDALSQARAIREGGPYDRSLGNVYLQLALLHSRLAEWDEALAMSLRAVEVFEQLNEPAAKSRALRTRATALGRLGQDERAQLYARDALQAAEQSQDPMMVAAALAELAALLAEPGEAMRLHLSARDRYRELDAAELEQRQALLAARRALDADDIATAQELLAPETTAHSRRNSALLALVQAQLAVQQQSFADALAHSASGHGIYTALRDHDGMSEAAALGLTAAIGAREWPAAAQHRRALLDLHWQYAQGLASPAHAATLERRAQALAAQLLIWHRQAPQGRNPAELLRSSLIVAALPRWRALGGNPRDWQRYRYAISELALVQSENAREQALRRIESLESRLETRFARNAQTLPAEIDISALRRNLGRHQLFLAVLRHGDQGVALAVSHAGVDVIDGLALNSDSSLAARASAYQQIHWIGLRASLDAAAFDRDQLLIRRVGVPPFGFDEQPMQREAPVALLALGEHSLPGVVRERAWLRKHYGARLREIDPGRQPIALGQARLLHIAAHGWDAAERPLASMIAATPAPSAQALSIAQLEIEGAPSLVILNVCEGGAVEGALSQAEQLALVTGATVIAPKRAIDDRAAYALATALHAALDQQAPLSAFRHALDRSELAATDWQISMGAAALGEVTTSKQ